MPSQPSQSGHTPSPAQQLPQFGHNHLPPPGAQFPFPDPSHLGPPPPPTYGFHMLDRRTIVLADGSVRSYFALPPEYQDFTPPIRPPMDPAGRFMPMGPGGLRPELGFDKRFPPGGGPMSPEGFRGERDDRYGIGRHNQDYWNSLGLDGRGGPQEGPMKRKYGEDDRDRREERDGIGRDGKDELARHRQQLLHYGNVGSNPNGYALGAGDRGEFLAGTSSPFGRGDDMRSSKYMRLGGGYDSLHLRQGGENVSLKHRDVDQKALKDAFLRFVKLVNENTNQRKNYLEDGKQGPLQCVACDRSSKDFPDMHALIMHTYHSDNADLLVDHLGLHKALCILMGWNYSKPPDNSKAYQLLSADEAAANEGDLIMWPPLVIIHNTCTGKGRDGRMEGFGNKAMDVKLRDLGCRGGKSKALYNRDGHQGVTLVKFTNDQLGLKEAFQLAEFFEKENHGRRSWAHVQSLTAGKDDENNPNLVMVDERTGEKKRIFYGYLGTSADLDKIDFETRKKIGIESLREYMMSK